MSGDHSVFDNQTFAGSIRRVAAGCYEASNLDGELIGQFESAAAAARAVLNADKDEALLALIERKSGEAAR